MSFAQIKADIQKVDNYLHFLENQMMDLENDLMDLRSEEALLLKVEEIFRQLISEEVEVGCKTIDDLLTEGMQAVFSDQDLSFASNVRVNRGKISVDFDTTHKREGFEVVGNSRLTFGGSVSSLQSVLLRVAVILRHNMKKILVLDESLPAFEDKYIESVGLFLRTLAKKTGMDILCVTHNPLLYEMGDLRYRVENKKGKATYKAE